MSGMATVTGEDIIRLTDQLARLQMENAQLQERAQHWAYKATEEAGYNKPLRDELAAAKEDSKRLDWLESESRGIEVNFNGDCNCHEWCVEDVYQFRKIRPALREAIDAARFA